MTYREFIATYSPIKGLFTVHIMVPLPSLKTKNFKNLHWLFLIYIFFLLLVRLDTFSHAY